MWAGQGKKIPFCFFSFSISFFLDEKRNKKIKTKRSLRALFIFKIRNRKRTKALSGSSKKMKIHSSPAPRFARPTRLFLWGLI